MTQEESTSAQSSGSMTDKMDRVREHAVKFKRSDSFRRSGMKFALLSSKCTCMSTMRVSEEACAGWSDAAPGERVSAEARILGRTAAGKDVSIVERRAGAGVPLFPGASEIEKYWCGRWELNPHGPFKPCGFSYHFGFRRRQLAFVVWTIPSP